MIATLFLLLVALQIADAVTTVKVLKQGGEELNPVLAPLMRVVGVVPSLVLVKAVLLGTFVAAGYVLPANLLGVALILADIVYAAIVVSNIEQIK